MKTNITLLTFLVFFIFTGQVLCGNIENDTKDSVRRLSVKNISHIMRPSPDELHSLIRNGRSLISEKTRIKISDMIRTMDNAHISKLEGVNAGISSEEVRNIFTSSSGETLTGSGALTHWINEKTKMWPKLTPVSERGIYSALTLQVDMLDVMLSEKDRGLAEALRKSRMMISIRKTSRRTFGDVRDVFVGTLIDKLCQISELQEALGAPGKLECDLPVGVTSFSEVETILVKRIRFVTQKSLKILKPASSSDV